MLQGVSDTCAKPAPLIFASLIGCNFKGSPAPGKQNKNAAILPRNSPSLTHPVGLYPPNTLPLVDLHNTTAGPFLSSFLWKDLGSQPSLFAS